MSLRRFLSTNRNAEADQSLLGSDEPPSYTSNITTAPPHTLPGRDSVRPSESSHSGTLGVAETSQISTPNYSKRPSGKFKFSLLICVNFVSVLSDLC